LFESAGCGNISFSVNGTITLASPLPSVGNMNITGPGTNNLTIDGAGAYSIFNFAAGSSNRVSGVRLANALSLNSGASVLNAGRTVLENCVISNSLAMQAFGGAV